MDLIYAMIDYGSQNKLKVLSAIVAVLCWAGNKLVNRHYDRKIKMRRDALNQELKKRGIKPPPEIPRPPE